MNKDKNNIYHKGIVSDVKPDLLKVRIEAKSACAACKAHVICGVDTAEKEIDIYNWTGEYKVGEEVEVVLKDKLGYKAFVLAYFVPFLIILFTILILSYFNVNEGIIAITSLLSVVPYLFILYLLRNKFKKEFSFEIIK